MSLATGFDRWYQEFVNAELHRRDRPLLFIRTRAKARAYSRRGQGPVQWQAVEASPTVRPCLSFCTFHQQLVIAHKRRD